MADPFQTCLQQIIQKAGEGSDRRATSTELLGGVYDYWRAELRVEAIRRGMEYIYVLSRDSSVFNTFGNDIIQCFYDLSRVGKSSPSHAKGNSRTHSSPHTRIFKCCKEEMAVDVAMWLLEGA